MAKVIQIPVNPADWQTLRAAAKARRMTLAAWARVTLIDTAAAQAASEGVQPEGGG